MTHVYRRLMKTCVGVATVLTAVGQDQPVDWRQWDVRDPGVRVGPIHAGGSIAKLKTQEAVLFDGARKVFAEQVSVSGTIADESGTGLGPRFNMNSCSGCHAFPAIGGTSPQANPQITVANLHGATNRLPVFISANGPVRVVRFKRHSDGSVDGAVQDLFVITGRSDTNPSCQMTQPDFLTHVVNENVSFRIPTPIFGAGLIEAIPDSVILDNKSTNRREKALFGITGRENRNGSVGSISRFGWKAQNESLLTTAGEAYNIEQGVTNELFPNSRDTDAACDTNSSPEDHMDYATGALSDIQQFALFMRMLAPLEAVHAYGNVSASSITNGRRAFEKVGCALCHTEVLNTGFTTLAALSNKPVRLFSDLLLHHMGPNLSDDIAQGNATADEFRTSPLWGLGERIFLLHDGRTLNLIDAIMQHSSPGSEANTSIRDFEGLGDQPRQDLINFLRSL